MPNRFTKGIDLAAIILKEGPAIKFYAAFDSIFGEWNATEKQIQAWRFLTQARFTYEADNLPSFHKGTLIYPYTRDSWLRKNNPRKIPFQSMEFLPL